METVSTTPPTPLSRALETIKRLKAQLDRQGANQPLAVVGVGMRFPGAPTAIDSLDAYWQALADGRDLVRPMPAARKARFAAEWDALPHKGGFLDEVTGFDAAFFGISPREARALDPQHRLLLEVAWEALENAALPPDRVNGARTGLYIGITGQDYRDWQIGAPDVYWATGNGHCFAAGRLAYAMGFTGPAIAVDTACSSSLVAVHLAAQALRRGECDVAVAGGVSLILSPRSTRLVKQTGALAPDGLCKTFDARANGYARGEGCGVVVLKRLDHALRDGDLVHAVIRGSAVNQDGRSSGFTAPNVLAQTALIEAALADAALTPADIGFVEAHGTGTPLGDPIEMAALIAALGRKNGGAPLHVGSVKTNFGHLEAAAGIAGLLKAIACCARRAIPALVHYKTLNPRIDLDGTGITLPTSLVPWSGSAGRFAGVSSFGLSGTNAHVIVGPADPTETPPAHAATGFEIAARTPAALRELAARLRTSLAALPDDDYPAFAYTATFGRARHAVRAQIAASDKPAAIAALEAVASDAPSAAVTLGTAEPPVELPRRVVVLPNYPWQREHHAPQAASAPEIAWSRPPSNEPVASDSAPRAARATPSPLQTTASPSSSLTSPARISLLALPAPARLDAARSLVQHHLAAVLHHSDVSAVPPDASFYDLGLDSLMAVDLARELSLALGIELTVLRIFENPTVDDLAAAIVAPASAPAVAAPPVTPSRAPRVAFLFSCQGSQYFGMGRELHDTEPVFRARIDDCDRILRPLLGASIRDLMMHGDDRNAIHQTRVTQPALVALELALADLWSSWGVTASAVLGHSLGEVAAAIHAGVMDLESGLALAVHRGRLMQSTADGAMLAVAAPLPRVVESLRGTEIDIAAVNGPESIVVSGEAEAIRALSARLHAEGIKTRPAVASLASHSRLMDPILPALHSAIANLSFHAPRLPIVSGVSGRLAARHDHDASYWCRHVREPVRFHQAAQALRALDIDVCIELGPDATLVNLVTAAGLFPAERAVASLRRGVSDRATMLAAVDALHRHGQELVGRNAHTSSSSVRATAPLCPRLPARENRTTSVLTTSRLRATASPLAEISRTGARRVAGTNLIAEISRTGAMRGGRADFETSRTGERRVA